MRTKNSSLNVLFGIFSLVLTSILGFILSKVFLNNLGVEYNGLNGVFNNIINILAITELGVAGAINYSLYKPIAEKDYDKISAILVIYKKFYKIIGLVIFGLSLVVTFFVPLFFKERTILDNYIRLAFILCTINTVVSYFFAYNRNLFYSMQKNYIVSIIDCIFKILKYLTQMVILIVFQNFIIYLCTSIVFTIINNLTIHFMARHYYPIVQSKTKTVDKKIEKEILKSVKSLAIIQLLSTLINFTDNLIISTFISVISSGLYVNYNFIFSQLTQIVNTIFHGFGASIGNLIAEENRNKIKAIFINLQYVSFIIGIFCTCCLFFLTEPFISFWIGKQYLLNTSVLVVLIFNFYLLIQRQPINYYLNTGGYFKKLILPFSLEAIINLVISILFALKFGIIGVFIGTMVSSLISYFISAKRVAGVVDISFTKYVFKEVLFALLVVCNIVVLKVIFGFYVPSLLIFRLIYVFIVVSIVVLIQVVFILFKDKNVEYLKSVVWHMLSKLFKIKLA